jgi:TolA-binding protein
MKIPSTILVAGIVVLLFSGPSASAKDNDIVLLQGDIVKLQQTVQKLQDSVDAKNATMTSQMEKIADAVNNISLSMQKMADQIGTIHTDNTAAATASAASVTRMITLTGELLGPLTSQIADLQKSVKTTNETVTSVNTQMKTLTDMAMKATTSTPNCKELKQDADQSYNSNYLDDAVTGYRQFMSQCLSDPRASEVQYQIADSLFNLKKYDQAVLDYDIFLNNYPVNDKTPSALLRKGSAYVELKNTTEAKAAFTRVTKEFPNTSQAATAASKLKELAAAPAGRGGRGTQ